MGRAVTVAYRTLCCTMFVTFFAVVLLQVASRYLFGTSFIWAEEVARFTFIWAAFLGGAEAVWRRRNIVIDIVPELMDPKYSRFFDFLETGLSILFLSLTAWLGYEFVNGKATQLSSILRLPMWIVYMAVPVGCLLMIIAYLVRAKATLKESPSDA